jgi:imidazole glycerol phosphate synthase subunit HisF
LDLEVVVSPALRCPSSERTQTRVRQRACSCSLRRTCNGTIFHFGQHTIGEAKAFLTARGLEIRR